MVTTALHVDPFRGPGWTGKVGEGRGRWGEGRGRWGEGRGRAGEGVGKGRGR